MGFLLHTRRVITRNHNNGLMMMGKQQQQQYQYQYQHQHQLLRRPLSCLQQQRHHPLASSPQVTTASNKNNNYSYHHHHHHYAAIVTTNTTTSCRYYSSTKYKKNNYNNKLGLGGNNWSRMEPTRYEKIVEKSIEQGITVLEAGQEGGDQALLDAYKLVQEKKTENIKEPITMTIRIGYRTVHPQQKEKETTTSTSNNNEKKEKQEQSKEQQVKVFAGDVEVEQHPFLGPNRTMTPMDDQDLKIDTSVDNDEDSVIHVFHNTSEAYIQHELRASSLVTEYQSNNKSSTDNNSNENDNKNNSMMRVVALLHNPEAQIMAMATEQDINKVSIEDRQAYLQERLVDAFCGMEKAVANQQISSYGVASNGLCLPREHPLYLSTDTVFEAAKIAADMVTTTNKCHLSVIQLPINLMERTGLDIARDLHAKIQSAAAAAAEEEENTEESTTDKYQFLRDDPPLEIYAMRPLTCYPDRGTGTGHAFRLVDYLLPSGPGEEKEDETVETDESVSDKTLDEDDGQAQKIFEDQASDENVTSKQWSNEMYGPPLIYSIALKKAMAHFDAEEILEEKMKRELTPEERETLDGCKLLQSMLHDLDVGLANVRSLGAHEQDLYQRIIPLIHDTFEGYDEETGSILEMFFKAYSLAVRYSIARNTRALLQKGGDDGKGYKYKEIPDEERLQDYALKYLVKEEAISKVIVGATQPDHVSEIVKVCSQIEDQEKEET